MDPQEIRPFKELPQRPREVVTWETRIELTIMAELLDYMEQCGVFPRTRSELLRHSVYALRQLLEDLGKPIERFYSYEQALERLDQSRLVNLNNPRSYSSKPALHLAAALTREDGYERGMNPKLLQRHQRNEKTINGQTTGYDHRLLDEPLIEGQIRPELKEELYRFEVIEEGKKEEEKRREETRAAMNRPKTPEEIEKAAALDKSRALRKQFKKSMEINTDDVSTEDFHNWNRKRLELGRPPLHFQIYAMALKKGLKLEEVDQEIDFKECFEFINTEQARKYVDVDAEEPDHREPTKEELRAAMLEGLAKVQPVKPVD